MYLGVVVYFVDIDRKAVSHPGGHAERRVQRGCGCHDGIPGAGPGSFIRRSNCP
jgi:hypothetical protein